MPANTVPTRPASHRNDPERDAVYAVDEPQYQTMPFPPPPFRVIAHYNVTNLGSRTSDEPVARHMRGTIRISAPVMVTFADEKGRGAETAAGNRAGFFRRTGARRAGDSDRQRSRTDRKVGVSSNLTGESKGSLRLEAPSGWRIEPERFRWNCVSEAISKHFEFKVVPGSLKEGHTQIRAVLTAGGKNYSEGYTLVTREDLASAYYYQPAVQRVSIVDVKVPKDLKVAYVPGAGDEIPTVLQQIGIDVTVIPAEKLASEDLARVRNNRPRHSRLRHAKGCGGQ